MRSRLKTGGGVSLGVTYSVGSTSETRSQVDPRISRLWQRWAWLKTGERVHRELCTSLLRRGLGVRQIKSLGIDDPRLDGIVREELVRRVLESRA